MPSRSFSEVFTLKSTIQIRPCRFEDLPKLEWGGLFTQHREIFEKVFNQQECGETLMLVADLKGFPVGQIWIDFAQKREESVGILWALRVYPLLQGMGVGKELVRAAEKVLRNRNFRVAQLGVEKQNSDVLPFYARLGYAVVGEEQKEFCFTTPGGTLESIPVDEWVLRSELKARGKLRITSKLSTV
jgi:ribosomal protein S18 acetylase RimI-like enzyme